MKFTGTLVSIHGFLGSPSDWLGTIPLDQTAHSLDLFSHRENESKLTFPEVGEFLNEKANSLPSPRVLLGYSLGGRIALHALLASPQLWSGAVIVSAHPGLTDDQERNDRLQAD